MLEENRKEELKTEELEHILGGTNNADYKYKIGYIYYINTLNDTYRYYKVANYSKDPSYPYTSEIYFVDTKSETCQKATFTVDHTQGRIDVLTPATSIPFI